MHNLCLNLLPMLQHLKSAVNSSNNGRSDYHLLLWFHLTSTVVASNRRAEPKDPSSIRSSVCPCYWIAERGKIQETKYVSNCDASLTNSQYKKGYMVS